MLSYCLRKVFSFGREAAIQHTKQFLMGKGFFFVVCRRQIKEGKEEGGFPNRISLSASLKKDFFFILFGSNMTSRKKEEKDWLHLWRVFTPERRKTPDVERDRNQISGFFFGENGGGRRSGSRVL